MRQCWKSHRTFEKMLCFCSIRIGLLFHSIVLSFNIWSVQVSTFWLPLTTYLRGKIILKSQKVWIEIRLVSFFARSPIIVDIFHVWQSQPFLPLTFLMTPFLFCFFLLSGDLNSSSTFCDRGGGGLVVGMARLWPGPYAIFERTCLSYIWSVSGHLWKK